MLLKICVAQLNYCVGDMAGNARKIIAAARKAYADGARLVLTPELAICGYAAEDLFLIKSKREQNLLNLNAEQRYLQLFKERPELLKFVPLKYISSYIGVTAQALSRIRKRIS